MLKVLIIDNKIKRSKSLKQSLIENGFDVVAHVENGADIHGKCCELQPDVVIIDSDFIKFKYRNHKNADLKKL